jgi:hypothetical protein
MRFDARERELLVQAINARLIGRTMWHDDYTRLQEMKKGILSGDLVLVEREVVEWADNQV